MFEEDLEQLELKVAEAIDRRDGSERKEYDIGLLANYMKYFMEHVADLLIVPNNPLQQRALFSLLFEEMPTYNDLLNGTPRLSQYFEPNQQKALAKGQLVSPERLELSTNSLKGCCSAS